MGLLYRCIIQNEQARLVEGGILLLQDLEQVLEEEHHTDTVVLLRVHGVEHSPATRHRNRKVDSFSQLLACDITSVPWLEPSSFSRAHGHDS